MYQPGDNKKLYLGDIVNEVIKLYDRDPNVIKEGNIPVASKKNRELYKDYIEKLNHLDLIQGTYDRVF